MRGRVVRNGFVGSIEGAFCASRAGWCGCSHGPPSGPPERRAGPVLHPQCPRLTTARRKPSSASPWPKTRDRRAHLASAVVLLSAACASPHPDEVRPELDVLMRDGLRAAWAGPASSGEYPGDAPFWVGFQDEVLDGLVREALIHNQDLAASAERLRAAAGRSRIARSARRPQLDANATYARQQNVFVGLPIPGATGPLATTFDQWNASLDLAWEVDLWGKLAAAVDAASADVAATAADLSRALA